MKLKVVELGSFWERLSDGKLPKFFKGEVDDPPIIPLLGAVRVHIIV